MNIIEVSHLKFAYSNQKMVLDIQEFQLQKAQRIFIYGPSGCGKSTFLNLMAGVLSPSAGQIQLFGSEIGTLSSRQRDKLRAQKMGYIFQSFNLIPYLSVLDNILLPSMLETHGISKTDHHRFATEAILRLGLVEQTHQKASTLSIGQQQRVAQARALMGKPELIIADEPTSSLDQNNTEEFMKFLVEQSVQRKIALLFVSHDRRLESYFDRSVDLTACNRVISGELT